MKKFLQWLLAPARIVLLQPVYEKLHLFTLYAMNYGGGSFTDDSGEEYVVRYVARKTAEQSEPVTIFDVGANVGTYAQMILKGFGKRATIHCFEPSRATYQTLKANVPEQNVYKHNIGLSDQAGELALYTDAEQSGMTSVYERDLQHIQVSFAQHEVAAFSTADEFAASQGIKQIDLLKIDVEGHELAVLKGASKLIEEQRIRFIQFEFGGTSIDSRTYFRDFWHLLSPNFTLYRIVGNGLRRIDAYSEFLEIFVTVNFLAERK
ncbi:FkbM family methyltransferase [Spirosoma sp. KCTC 42546]|uniref:FkbM family methyltransferase n=1 Tax=Spirosoma sp. KCTC 42546 TaxID=2520506 RepID=UPI00115B85BB|nr:FkbM family methyltransferase [Spirosoma sp. KCTC 42546]QDK77227.1 FkbM family methyltransferase [Spirosoma sp. KCTC 42546]